MNCVQPIAPAEDGPMLQPCADSTSVSPASTCQRRPNAFAARWKIGLRIFESLHGDGERRPLVCLGLRPRRKLLRAASEVSEATFGVLALRRFRRQTAAAGCPALDRVWRQLRCRWWPRPWLASPL